MLALARRAYSPTRGAVRAYLLCTLHSRVVGFQDIGCTIPSATSLGASLWRGLVRALRRSWKPHLYCTGSWVIPAFQGAGGARRHLCYSGRADWTMPGTWQPGSSLTSEHDPLGEVRRSHAMQTLGNQPGRGRGPRKDTCGHNSNCGQGNAGDRAQNIQGPVNVIDLCHALQPHRGSAETIYSKFQLTCDYTSPKGCSGISGCRAPIRD